MDRGGAVRIGIVCPYSLDVPGGVQSHVLDLARALIALGHSVSVIAPADDERADGDPPLPAFVTPAGRAVSVPYNGSVARITFGPVSYARVRRWLAEHTFDVLHLHEPGTFSLSSLALFEADVPIVATFHTSTERSRATLVFARPINALMEKVTARIAVSPMARRVQVEHLGGDAVEIPNGVDVRLFAQGPLLPGYPRDGHTVGFLGRYDEPRKGMAVLLDALRRLAPARPGLRLLVVGRGDPDALRRAAGPELADRLDILGGVDDATKAAALRSMDVYCAPNTGGESFGMVLTEAMAAGTAVLASDLGAFRAVLSAEGDPPEGSRVPGRACCSRPATPAGSPPRSPRCSTTRSAGPPSVRRLAPGPPRSTGRSSPRTCCGSTAPPSPPTPAACPAGPRRAPDDGPDAGRAGARPVAHGVGGRRRGAAPGRGRHRDLRGAGPAAGPPAPADGRRPRRPRRRAGPAGCGRAAGGRRAGRVRGGHRRSRVARRRVRGPRRVPYGAAPGRAPASTPARWRRTRSPAGSPGSTAACCPPGSRPSSRTSSSPS